MVTFKISRPVCLLLTKCKSSGTAVALLLCHSQRCRDDQPAPQSAACQMTPSRSFEPQTFGEAGAQRFSLPEPENRRRHLQGNGRAESSAKPDNFTEASRLRE